MISARSLCIASGKGGTGKSVLATNLAFLLASRGERVCLIDYDAGLANDHLLLGLAPRYDLRDLIEGRVGAFDALVTGPGGLRLLCGGVGRAGLLDLPKRDLERLLRALEPLEQGFDHLVIDHGAGLSFASQALLAAAPTLLLVTSPELPALSDAYAVYKHALQLQRELRVGLCVNRSSSPTRAEDAWLRFSGVAQRFLGHCPERLGEVPEDAAVVASVEARAPVCALAPSAPAALAIGALARWAASASARGPRPLFEAARRGLR